MHNLIVVLAPKYILATRRALPDVIVALAPEYILLPAGHCGHFVEYIIEFNIQIYIKNKNKIFQILGQDIFAGIAGNYNLRAWHDIFTDWDLKCVRPKKICLFPVTCPKMLG